MAMSSMDDKMLGEKVTNYCSSSEDEDGPVVNTEKSSAPSVGMPRRSRKSTVQTGPKGVIEDWRSYKSMEYEKRQQEKENYAKLINKLSLTCDPNADKSNSDDGLSDDDQEFMKWYNRKRIKELKQKFAAKWVGITFGKVKQLNASNYVEEIENEKKFVTVIIHIYDDKFPACEAMNGCLQVLAQEYRTVKFCKIKATDAKVSQEFINTALPVLLVYKDNEIIGNYVQLSTELGEDFYADKVEEFLHEHGILPEKHGHCGSDGVDADDVSADVDSD